MAVSTRIKGQEDGAESGTDEMEQKFWTARRSTSKCVQQEVPHTSVSKMKKAAAFS